MIAILFQFPARPFTRIKQDNSFGVKFITDLIGAGKILVDPCLLALGNQRLDCLRGQFSPFQPGALLLLEPGGRLGTKEPEDRPEAAQFLDTIIQNRQ